MKIRTATPQDSATITSLLSAFHDAEQDEAAIHTQLGSDLIGRTQQFFVVVDDTDTPVGTTVVNLVYKFPDIEARIGEVFVDETQRGKGLSTLLMDAAEAWAWEHEAKYIELSSRPSRIAANALYQKRHYDLRDTNVYCKKRG